MVFGETTKKKETAKTHIYIFLLFLLYPWGQVGVFLSFLLCVS